VLCCARKHPTDCRVALSPVLLRCFCTVLRTKARQALAFLFDNGPSAPPQHVLH